MDKTNLWRAGVAGAAVAGITLGYLAGVTRDDSATPMTATLAAMAPVAEAPGGTTGAYAGFTVTGSGTVSGTPDTLILSMGVQSEATTVSAALDTANARAAAVQKSLRDHGVADKDVQTSGLSIQPSYDSPTNGTPKIKGYQVGENLTAKLHDLKTAGATLSAAAEAGGDATRINSVSLDLNDTSALLASARERAYAQAKTKAEQYAKAAGVSVGKPVSIQESVQTPQPAQPFATAGRAADSMSSVPIQAGSKDVVVDVTVVFSFG
jgi:uncharacterized protein YggE